MDGILDFIAACLLCLFFPFQGKALFHCGHLGNFSSFWYNVKCFCYGSAVFAAECDNDGCYADVFIIAVFYRIVVGGYRTAIRIGYGDSRLFCFAVVGVCRARQPDMLAGWHSRRFDLRELLLCAGVFRLFCVRSGRVFCAGAVKRGTE